MIISLSLYQRLKVIKIVINTVSDNNRGICFKRLKTNTVSMASFGILPLAAKRKTITALCATTIPDKTRIVDRDVKNNSVVNDFLKSM